MDVYSLIEEWSLDRDGLSFKRFTRAQISEIASALTAIYSNPIEFSAGRKHLSLHDSVSAIEGLKPLPSLSSSLLLSKQIWLPDPLYSALSLHTKSVWRRLPESGPKNINGNLSAYMPWGNYWSTTPSERISYLDSVVPGLVKQLLKVKPLVQCGLIYLFPWELIIRDSINDIRSAVLALQSKTDVLKVVTRKYRQHEYSIGARLGPIGLMMKSDPSGHAKEGDPLWFGDPSDVLYGGLINTLATSALSADFINTLKGDRLIHDFIRSGGEYSPVIENQARILLPNLNNAIWEDIVAIKKDSELVSILAGLIDSTKNLNDEHAYAAMKEELKEIEGKLSNDLSIMKLVSAPFAELSIGTMAGVTTGLLSGAGPLGSLAVAGITSVSTFLLKLASAHQSDDRRVLMSRKDIICNISSSLN